MSDFSIVNFDDLDDVAAGFGLGDVQEARFATRALGCEQLGLGRIDMKPGAGAPFAHRHGEQEEIYVVVAGAGTATFDGTQRELRAGDAVRVSPSVLRSFAAGADGLSLLAFGAPAVSGGENDAEIVEVDASSNGAS